MILSCFQSLTDKPLQNFYILGTLKANKKTPSDTQYNHKDILMKLHYAPLESTHAQDFIDFLHLHATIPDTYFSIYFLSRTEKRARPRRDSTATLAMGDVAFDDFLTLVPLSKARFFYYSLILLRAVTKLPGQTYYCSSA